MQTANLPDSIYHDLLRRILGGEVAPGERLESERSLAERYGATRNTLREAIRKLEHDRLVTVQQGRGVTVLDFRRTATVDVLGAFLLHAPDPGERLQALVDVLLARTKLMELSVRLAATRADAADRARLDGLVADLREAFGSGEIARLLHADVALIDGLVDAAHSLPARWIANTLLGIFTSMIRTAPDLWVKDPALLGFLDALEAAIAGRDPEAAAQAASTYYTRVDALVLERLAEATPTTSPPPHP